MDTTDYDIEFDNHGVCNHCRTFVEDAKAFPQTPEDRAKRLKEIVADVKADGVGKEYDCIIGLSGGVDSTYVAYLVKKLGLRPLAVHLDNGWNSELAQKNIENIVKKLDIDLYTHVLDWDQFRELQKAFLRASTTDCEIPTDHAIVAVLLDLALKYKVNYILSGNNHNTEGVLPFSYSYGCFDWKYIRSVHKIFSKKSLKGFPHFSFSKRLYFVLFKKIRNIGILNYIEYDKAEAMKTIENELDWKYYGGKHYESVYTRFYQGYILPEKFSVDKRRAHLSSLICSGQMSREEALEELKKPSYPSQELLDEDKVFVTKKLGLSMKEFEEIMSLPPKYATDYPTYKPMLDKTMWLKNWAKSVGILPKRVGI